MNLVDLPDLVDTWTASHVNKFFDLHASDYGLEQEHIQLLGPTTGRALKKLTQESLKNRVPEGTIDSFIELIQDLRQAKGLPEPAPPSVVPITPDFLSKLDEIHKEIFRVQVRLSVVSSTDYNNILSIFGLAKPKPITLDVVPTRKSLPDHFFNWGVETEPAQMDKCLNWIKTLITLPPNLVMFSVASQSSFLTLPIGDASRYILKGTTDIAIVSKIYVENLDTICGLKVVIELKKTVSEAAHRQVVMQLLAASVSSSFPVLAILTDLKQFWQFMWLDKSGIQETCFDLCHAISFIDQILLEDGCNPIIKMYTMEAYLKEKEGTQRPQGPGSPAVVGKQGVKQILSRPRVDGYDIMPKGDVGNMEEFYDEMSKEEIEQHKLNVVIRHVTSSAYWQSFASDTVLSV